MTVDSGHWYSAYATVLGDSCFFHHNSAETNKEYALTDIQSTTLEILACVFMSCPIIGVHCKVFKKEQYI